MKSLLFENKTKAGDSATASLQPISEYPEFRAQQDLVNKLKGELNRLRNERTAVIHRQNAWCQPRVDVIAEQYISGADSIDLAARPALQKTIDITRRRADHRPSYGIRLHRRTKAAGHSPALRRARVPFGFASR